MRFFLPVFVFLLFSFSIVSGEIFRDIVTIELKKDEQKKILVKYDEITKLFKFNWTLYKNGGLVIHRSYDRIVAQNILYLNFKNQSFRFDLKPNGRGYHKGPYILVYFKEFNYETNKATFELCLSDNDIDIKLKYLKK